MIKKERFYVARLRVIDFRFRFVLFVYVPELQYNRVLWNNL